LAYVSARRYLTVYYQGDAFWNDRETHIFAGKLLVSRVTHEFYWEFPIEYSTEDHREWCEIGLWGGWYDSNTGNVLWYCE